MRRPIASRLVPAVVVLTAAAGTAGAQSAIRVGTVKARAGETVTVPVYAVDLPGTPLGPDQAAGQRVQGVSFRVTFDPTLISAAHVSRAGALAAITPLFEAAPATASSAGFLASFDESSNAVPLTGDAAGELVATIELTVAAGAPAGAGITLTLDPATTALTNQAGTVIEDAAHGLQLISGRVDVDGTRAPRHQLKNPS